MLNKIILMGRLTKDPELRQTQSGISVCSFRLAVDRGTRSNDPNQPSADFIDIVAWRQQADFVSKWFRKGLLVAVVGRLQTRRYTDNTGANRTAYEVVADEVHFAESKRDADNGGYNGGYDAPAPSYGNNSYAPSAQQARPVDPMSAGGGFDDITDDSGDLPF